MHALIVAVSVPLRLGQNCIESLRDADYNIPVMGETTFSWKNNRNFSAVCGRRQLDDGVLYRAKGIYTGKL